MNTPRNNYNHCFSLHFPGPAECPIRSLVDDCAFIEDFADVDIDHRYRNKFQRACNRHQLCYTCVSINYYQRGCFLRLIPRKRRSVQLMGMFGPFKLTFQRT